MRNLKKGIITAMVLSTIFLSQSNINTIVAIDSKEIKERTSVDESNIINTNSQLYGGYIENLKNEILKEIKKKNKKATMEIVNLAFKIADERVSLNEKGVKEYFEMVALIISIMEVESKFNNDIICHNSTSNDYGIMQVNSAVISHAKKELNDNTLSVFNLEDNIKMGSWEIYQCLSKAQEKHPNNEIWWFYAYYNRGLWFENYSYDYNEVNQRSKKFINIFNNYFNILYNS